MPPSPHILTDSDVQWYMFWGHAYRERTALIRTQATGTNSSDQALLPEGGKPASQYHV